MKSRRATNLARTILIVAALIIPTLSLIPLGGWFLWERGWLLPWAIAALTIVLVVAFIEWLWLKTPATVAVDAAPTDALDQGRSSPSSTTTISDRSPEAMAREDIARIIRTIDVERLSSLQEFQDLAFETVTAVASRMRPGYKDPVWAFTMPEALAIIQQVSRRLGVVVETHVPFGDRMTLAQVRAAYRWRGAFVTAEKAYDVWRVLRLANPATALTHEARERLSRAVVNWGREQVTRRLAEEFVEEVGRAAIDLYSGRLRTIGAPRTPADATAVGVTPERTDVASSLQPKMPAAPSAPAAQATAQGARWYTRAFGGARQAIGAVGRSSAALLRGRPKSKVGSSSAGTNRDGER